MDSLTKIHLSDSELAKLVKGAFGGERTPVQAEELKDGWFNTIYSIRLDNSLETVLKISPPKNVRILRYEKDIMATEVEVLKLLKARGIPAPAVYYYDDSHTLLSHEYFFMEKVDGTSYSKRKQQLTEEQKESIESEIGLFNRRINEIKGKKFGQFLQPDKQYDSWSEAFLSMIRDILQDGREQKVALPASYDEIFALIAAKKEILDMVKEPCLVHWDLHAGNVIVGSNGKIAAILDCDRALWGDPIIEYYFSIANENFLKGYGTGPMQNKEAKVRRVLYNIYLYLIMVIESSYRGYEETHQLRAFKSLQDELNRFKEM